MSVTEQEQTTCVECGTPLSQGKCLNSTCRVAQETWSAGGVGDAAKAAAIHAEQRPAAWTRQGRVD